MSDLTTEPNQVEELGLDLELSQNSGDYYLSSEGEYEWESEEQDEFEQQEHGVSNSKEYNVSANNNVTLTTSTGALVPLDDDDDDENGDEDIGSDEERDLLKGIKDEIDLKVREEMKSELAMYKVKLKAIENGKLDTDSKNGNNDDLEGLDPKIKEALIKMRKLDRILNTKLKTEKRVKRDRILLERRMREEIAELKTIGKEHKDSKINTDKYLSLTLPSSHNEGVVVDSPSVTPVFQTQFDESDFIDGNKRHAKKASSQGDMTEGKEDCHDNIGSSQSMNDKKKKKQKKKDFIKRNKELAAQAEDIAMTDEEKKRVSGLLTDLDALPELPEDETPFIVEDNPFQIAVRQGMGFLPDNIELRSLASIDGQLKNIMPNEDYESLMSGAVYSSPQHKLFTRVDVKSVLDCERYGERALLETKEQRDMKEKLKRIEEDLAQFTFSREMQLETPSLSGEQLHHLLDECARTMSRVSSVGDIDSLSDTTPRSLQSTSRSSIYDNPPVLPYDVLQKLLAEAYCPISSKLSSVTELEEDREQGEEREPISAETWRVVAEQEVDEAELENLRIASQNSAIHRQSRNSRSRHSSFEEYDQNIYNAYSDHSKPEYKDKKTFLPEISKSPFLISQGFNNDTSNNCQRGSGSDKGAFDSIHNSLHDSKMMVESFSDAGDTTPTPCPPTYEKRPSSNQSNRSIRTTPNNGSF